MTETRNTTPATTAVPGYVAGTWKADPAHSEIAFSVRLLGIIKTRGRFTTHDVTLVTDEDPLRSSVTATIDLASIDTGNAKRDNHLQSDGYLDVDTYPTMSYHSTGIRQTVGGWTVDGELTLHGVTRQVPLTLKVNAFTSGRRDERRAGFSATAEINRRDFGIDTGGVALSNKVSVSLEIQAVLHQ
ncbi:polyisoprenoid-binding protein [Streptomyces antnestii]|uniref:Polyisoprenoid-binding protein n=1 Tax=Streptomyces antnestii TaxID=2494256 RepID=A0A437P087_9ACTN|nr:YceI family protein [Streptomyces sp. San01]RVU15528.1 polyisoprenoid-binding protein [Streptomyces sp. San01]